MNQIARDKGFVSSRKSTAEKLAVLRGRWGSPSIEAVIDRLASEALATIDPQGRTKIQSMVFAKQHGLLVDLKIHWRVRSLSHVVERILSDAYEIDPCPKCCDQMKLRVDNQRNSAVVYSLTPDQLQRLYEVRERNRLKTNAHVIELLAAEAWVNVFRPRATYNHDHRK